VATVLEGLVDTEDVLGDERVVDMSEDIKHLDPDRSQFTTMLNRMASKEATREKVNWLELELFPRISALAASAASADTSIVVTTGEGSYFRAGDVVRNALTGDAFRVTSISTDTLTVVRGIGDVTAASSASGAQLVIISNAAAQGATLGTRKMVKKVLGYNYTQIFRSPFGFTNTNVAIERYGGQEPMVEAEQKLVEHKRGLEQSAFWGARDFITSGTTPVGVTGGLVEYLSTNVDDAGGTLTEANLDSYLRDGLQHGPDSTVIFCSPLVMQAISGFLRDNIQAPSGNDRLWGAKVDAYISGAYGTKIPVFVKREWNDFSSASDQYGGWAFGVNMKNVKVRPLRGRNTKLLRNRQANDADETTHEYLTELAFEVAQEKTHFIIKGVTG
jgi:hypothetical protein